MVKRGKWQCCTDKGQTGDDHVTWPIVLILPWDKISLQPKTLQYVESGGCWETPSQSQTPITLGQEVREEMRGEEQVVVLLLYQFP